MLLMQTKQGFTIVEILIVLAVLSLSVLAFAEVTNLMNRSVKYPEAQVNLGAISTVVRETLRYKTTCETSLAGNALIPSDVMNGTQEVQLLLPGVLADGTPLDDRLQANSRVQQLVLISLKTVNSVDLGAGKYFSEIEISAKVAATDFALKPIIAGGLFYTIAGNSFASCDTTNDDPVPLCEEMGCTWNPAATPVCQCTPIDLSCPPQQFVTGVDTEGSPICTPLGAGQCPVGTFLRGVSIGANDCTALVTSP